ncbi:Plant organelle RNA recognition domain [Dillenia turbinata]|uniref:Plant organelle RNA recognition domain n=1 Tax=Dillenia turbinata TaxID=194707 RepID=A0AAN8W342_9MAGN
MLFKTLKNLKPYLSKPTYSLHFTASISSLKVILRKDCKLDEAIESSEQWRLCARVVKEFLNEPGQAIPFHYLEKRRERLRLNFFVKTFIDRDPSLFEIYLDRIKPKTEPVLFVRPLNRLNEFLEFEKEVYSNHETLIVAKLLMMSKYKAISADKLIHVKREFGFPNNFMIDLVPKYPNYFRLGGSLGEGKSFNELVDWNPQFAKSVIEKRAEEE